MKKVLVSKLRDKKTTTAEYRMVTEQLGRLLALETAAILPKVPTQVTTPFGKAAGESLPEDIVLCPILRAGFALLPPFLELIPNARIGFFGMRRDEITLVPHLYYHKLPRLFAETRVIVLDPMIATGGSAVQAVELLHGLGVDDERLIFTSVIAAPEGLKRLQQAAPKAQIIVAQVDKGLNKQAFVTPGLGDFGDRYFGTEEGV